MKKALSLILALVMCLSLCACGGSNSQSPTQETTSQPTASELEVLEVSLNQKFTLGSYEIEITNVDFVESYIDHSILRRPTDGDYFIQVDYLVKNVGKTMVYSPLSCMSADYDNGYVFKASYSYHDVSEYDGGVTNLSELQPLSDAVDFRDYISVPDEVHTSEKVLAIKIKIDAEEAVLYIRK